MKRTRKDKAHKGRRRFGGSFNAGRDEGGKVKKPRRRKATHDSRDIRKADKTPIVTPPPYQMRSSFELHRITSLRNVALADALEELATRAVEDSREGSMARKDLYELLRDSVARMNRFVQKHPEQWRDLAGEEAFWPVNVSLHPYYVCGMKKSAAVRDFLDQTLGLGAKLRIRFDSYTKSKLSSPFTFTAHELIWQVDYARRMKRWLVLAAASRDHGELGRIVRRAARNVRKEELLKNAHRLRPTGWRAKATCTH